jgi:natural product biosynthesis luciferase-like monooxygenase protein
MELSLFFFADDSTSPTVASGGRYQLLLESARFADAHDFTAVWTPERHFHPFGGLYPNPSVTGAAVAAVTERVGIRAGSVVVPLHDPLRVVEEWSVVDNISRGRAGVSFASGWHPHDFTLNPARFADRRDVTLTAMETVRTLWRGESVPRVDGRGDPVDMRIYPPPIQSELPMWLTSAGSVDTFRAAGEIGAGVLTHLVKQGTDVLADSIGEYRKSFRAHGAAIPAPGHVTLMMHTFVGPDDSVFDELRGPMREYVGASLGLFKTGNATTEGAKREASPHLRERALEVSVERYFRTVGLFGSVERAVETVRRMRGIGVDEIACLIDFGMPTTAVLDSLKYLDQVRQAVV